jgi:D-alanyl-D-alanine carboxypeptidase
MFARLAVLVVILMLGAGISPAQANNKYAAIVLDYQTGEVLHSRRADVSLFPASLTKMMTLMMLFDALDRGELRLDSKLPVSRRAADMPASKLGLRAGSTISVSQAIQAMTVRSANDVAVVIAEALGGSESRFGEMMTERARALGMRNTTFKNASGLPNSRQKSTARDMALLAQRLIRNYANYYHYFSQDSFAFGGRTYRSHNRLNRSYRGMDGLKTGYTRASGFNLASSAVRNGQRVIVVVFGGRSAQTRDAEVVRLMDLGFDRLPERRREPLVALLPKPKPGTGSPAVAEAQMPEAGPSVVAEVIAAAPVLRPGTAEPSAAAAPASVLDALPEAERAAILAAAASTPLPAANPRAAVDQGVTEIGSGLVAGPAKAPAMGAYAVQVGAFHDPNLARRAAHQATDLLPEILLLGDIDISPLQGRRQMVYRARVAGFERETANRACNLLQAKRQECLVVRTAREQLASGTS